MYKKDVLAAVRSAFDADIVYQGGVGNPNDYEVRCEVIEATAKLVIKVLTLIPSVVYREPRSTWSIRFRRKKYNPPL